MQYTSQPTSIADQKILLTQRGMRGDGAVIEHWLRTVGYYRLGAYWLIWEEPPHGGQARSKIFKRATKFEDVRDLYIFDRQLRLLTMEAIDRIEIALRSRWTNRFSLAHGSHGHLQWQNFTSKQRHGELYKRLKLAVNRSKEDFIKHYKSKYTLPKMPPLWSCSELFSFGELSQWYSLSKDNKLKADIAKDLGYPTIKSFEGALQLFAYIRNISAHHARLWNRKTVKRAPKIKSLATSLQLSNSSGQIIVDNTMYNALTLIAHTLLYQSPDSSFASRLSALVDTQPRWQQKMMGFPRDWKKRPIWRANKTLSFWAKVKKRLSL